MRSSRGFLDEGGTRPPVLEAKPSLQLRRYFLLSKSASRARAISATLVDG